MTLQLEWPRVFFALAGGYSDHWDERAQIWWARRVSRRGYSVSTTTCNGPGFVVLDTRGKELMGEIEADLRESLWSNALTPRPTLLAPKG